MHLGGQLPPEGEGELNSDVAEPDSFSLFQESEGATATDNTVTTTATTTAMGLSAVDSTSSGGELKSTESSQTTECSTSASNSISLSVGNDGGVSLSTAGSPRRSYSPDPVPPSDLSPDPNLNPTAHVLSLGSVEPPVLSASVPPPPPPKSLSPSPPALTASPECSTLDDPHVENPTVVTPARNATPGPGSSVVTKADSPLNLLGDNDNELGNHPSFLSMFPAVSRSDLENLPSMSSQSTEHRSQPPPQSSASSPPYPMPTSGTVNQTSTLDVDLERTCSPKPNEESKVEASSCSTPKSTQMLSVSLDMDNQAVPILDTVEKDSVEPGQEDQEQTHKQLRELRTESFLSPSSVKDEAKDPGKNTGPKQEQAETLTPVSIAPTLPHPAARPEKKTYCCSECGKEYASRSGLKVRESCKRQFYQRFGHIIFFM